MKITLINPPITSAERYGKDIGDIGGHQAPLGLCYLAAVLEKNGYKVDLIDAETEDLENDALIARIRSFGSKYVGITSTTVAFHRALALAKAVKLLIPGTPVIIGGPHITANPHKTIAYDCFDYGVMREGEVTIIELLKAIRDRAPVDNIKGMIFRKGDRVIMTEPRPYIDNLDSLPMPARHLLPDVSKYMPPLGSYIRMPVLNMVTSRGCPYRCIFCDNNVFGRKIRYHSPERVIAEMEGLIRNYGAKEIAFLDDTFTVDKERVRKIIALMKEKKINVKWTCMSRVDTVTKELLAEMKESGCWQVSVGVESGDQAVLDFIRKGTRLTQVVDFVKWCHELGIYVKGFFMLGHPIDTAETIDKTIGFALSNPFDDVVATITTPILGTELYEIASKYGTFQDKDWSQTSYWRPVFVPHGLTEKLLYERRKQFYWKFYMRPRIILRQVRKITDFNRLIRYAVTIPKALLYR